MKYSEYVWRKIAPIYQSILQHPFNVELAAGTLDRKQFDFYLEQDAYYLISSSRVLALIAGRADSFCATREFLNFALGALDAACGLYTKFLQKNVDSDPVELSPASLAYTQYLIATAATASLEEAIAAILPCFWIYREVGRSIASLSGDQNPYIRWIEIYSDELFSRAADSAIALFDEMARASSKSSLKRMEIAFERSAIYEWHFWNDAYRMTLFRVTEPIALKKA